MDRHNESRRSESHSSHCTMCNALVNDDQSSCRSCAYGGLEPARYAGLFWDED